MSDNPTPTIEDMLQLWRGQLTRAVADSRHPWKTPVLATTNGSKAEQRILVLRRYEAPKTLLFYTDSRTPKIGEIAHYPGVSLLFWNPKKKIQLRTKGVITLHLNDAFAQAHWEKIARGRTTDYQSEQIPGSPITHPEEGWVTTEQAHFAVLEVTFTKVDLLQLRQNGHLRAGFEFNEAEKSWQGEWLVP